ncbi:2OG-Fe(II) oxygenase [Azospirillum halopraeferens]|uniref:2OG-Fe(II) oxygenase n=1 Tax=Azospirillum halopraeferens TaxID=34010 RepID=UPI00041FBC61|nr:2OG-Fe(II) oxygenase [Azospirillum halopraeferens]
MPSLNADVADVLATVDRPGDVCISGTVDLPNPGLVVDGVGPVALPLLPVQAEQLAAVAERAPYGRRAATLTDLGVRRTWQIDGARVGLTGRHWPAVLDGIVARVAEGLGVEGPVTAELYKLLLYAEGDFFVGHRDTEKAPGMFATLVVVLPSAGPAAGGTLIVRHRDREERLDLSPEDAAEARFAAFYADCVHEVTPVASGHRLTLIFNLIWQGRTGLPRPPDHERQTARLAGLLTGWTVATGHPDDDCPDKLVIPLEHAYTRAELGFATLKGADSAVAAVLADAAGRAGCALHLALLTIEESGIAEYTGYDRGYDRGYRRGGRGEPEMEAGEVTERRATLSQWRGPDDGDAGLEELPFEDAEVVPPERLEELEPDEEEFSEATGNAGASFERTYSRAALVLWPDVRFLRVIAGAGRTIALGHLGSLTQRARNAGESGDGDSLRRQARALAGLLVEDWQGSSHWVQDRQRAGDATRLMAALVRLEDGERIAAFLQRLGDVGGFAPADAPALADAAERLEPERAAALIGGIVAGTAVTTATRLAMLAAAAGVLPADARRSLAPAAALLLDALPGGPAAPPERQGWGAPTAVPPELLVDALRALGPVDPDLARRAVARALAQPASYTPDATLVPAALALADGAGEADDGVRAAAGDLRDAALAHLRARIALPLEPPRDWRRPATLPCTCPLCAELSRFLDDPGQDSWSLKAIQGDRTHVEETIRRSACDVDTRTLRKGSPHTLVCTKNRASYDRRVARRKEDLAAAARLGG